MVLTDISSPTNSPSIYPSPILFATDGSENQQETTVAESTTTTQVQDSNQIAKNPKG